MNIILFIIGYTFLFAGILSLAGLSNVGLDLVTITQLHTIPYLNEFPIGMVYTAAGLVFLILAVIASQPKS